MKNRKLRADLVLAGRLANAGAPASEVAAAAKRYAADKIRTAALTAYRNRVQRALKTGTLHLKAGALVPVMVDWGPALVTATQFLVPCFLVGKAPWGYGQLNLPRGVKRACFTLASGLKCVLRFDICNYPVLRYGGVDHHDPASPVPFI